MNNYSFLLSLKRMTEEYMPPELFQIIEMMNVAQRYSYEELVEICMNVESSRELCKNPELWERNMEIFRKDNNYSYTGMFSDSVWRKRTIFIGMLLEKDINPSAFNKNFYEWLFNNGTTKLAQQLLDNQDYFISRGIDLLAGILNQMYIVQDSGQKSNIAIFLLSDPRVKEYILETLSKTELQDILKYAAENDYYDIVKILLDYPGINPSFDDNEVIVNIARSDRLDIIDKLLGYPGVDPAVRDNEPIYRASENGRSNIVNRLLEYPQVDPSIEDNSPIKFAIMYGDIDLVNKLLEDPRVNINIRKYEIILAASEGDTDKVRELLEDPDINPSVENNSAIRLASLFRASAK